jgi:hypothetical protein
MHTFLMHGTGTGESITWSRLVCIAEFPDLGSEPENIDVTTMCDTMRKYIAGVQDTGALNFTAFYTPEAYTTISALAGQQGEKFAVWFGGTGDGADATPTGTNGKFTFSGELSVFVNGAGVNDPVQMTISILPSTEIAFSAS